MSWPKNPHQYALKRPLTLLPPLEETGFFTADWRMSDVALIELARLLVTKRPKRILEIGPGISSFVFFNYMSAIASEESEILGDVAYHIVDEAGPWHLRFKDRLQQYSFPYDSVWPVEVKNGYYDVGSLDFGEMDLISIDGPSESGDRNSEAARAFLEKHTGPSTVFLVDDTHRTSESELVEWIAVRRKERFGEQCDDRTQMYRLWDTLFPRRSTTFVVPS